MVVQGFGRPEEQPFGGGEGAEEGEEGVVGGVDGQVVVVAGEGEKGVGGQDADEEWGEGIDTILKEGFQVFRGEIVGPEFVVRAELQVAVAVELDQDAGELAG